MKNKLVILTLALGGLLSSSCSDAYEVNQKGEQNVPDAVYKNPADVLSAITAIYASIPGETEVDFVSTFTDELALGLENGGQGIISGEYAFRMEPGNDYAAGIWNGYYAMINRINRLEVVAKNLKSKNPSDAAEYNNSLAELYALRAYAHYKLFAYFTPSYTNGSGLSIINLDHVPPLDYGYALGRNTVSEVIKFIETDLKNAEDLRTSGWRDVNYANGGVINAIRVKLYSMTGNWGGVITAGNNIMSQGAYALANRSEYLAIFPRTQQLPADIVLPAKEIIFQLKRTANNGGAVAAAWYSGNVSLTGSPFYEVGRSLYNELDKLDPANTNQPFTTIRNDVRFEANMDPDTKAMVNYETLSQGEYQATDVLLVGKYQGFRASGASLRNSIPLFRSSDILLAMAEARAAQGELMGTSTDPDDLVNDYSSVYSILFNIRYFRSTNASGIVMPTITNQQTAFNAILNERRVEFAFEAQRYLDMKRIGAKAGSEGFTRYSKDCAVNGACNLPTTSYKMTLPIPVGEMNGNNSLTADSQNPGY